jgi:hypothetical protein
MSTNIRYLLTYLERPADSDAMINLVQPDPFLSQNDAYSHLFVYVKSRITDSYKDLFAENAAEEFGIPTFELSDDDSQAITDKQLETAFLYIELHSASMIKSVIDWYFELANDECNECAYSIKEIKIHNTVILIEQNVDFVSLFVNDVHVIDVHSEHPIKGVADRLAESLGTTVIEAYVTNEELAVSIAQNNGTTDKLAEMLGGTSDCDRVYEHFTNECKNADLLRAFKEIK